MLMSNALHIPHSVVQVKVIHSVGQETYVEMSVPVCHTYTLKTETGVWSILIVAIRGWTSRLLI